MPTTTAAKKRSAAPMQQDGAGFPPEHAHNSPAKGGEKSPIIPFVANGMKAQEAVNAITAQASLEQTMRLAMEAAGTDEAGFKRLPKQEQNAYLAQAAGQQRPEVIASAIKAQEGFQIVLLDRIDRSPTNRSEFDEEKLVELTDSIRAHGIMEPLVVRPMRYVAEMASAGVYMAKLKVGDHSYCVGKQYQTLEEAEMAAKECNFTKPIWQIVMGERRWICAGRAGLNAVPCIVRDLNEREALEWQLTENLQREDLRPLDEARGYKQMMDLGYKIEDLVEKLNRSRSSIYARLKLLELPTEAKAAVESGTLPASHAELLTAITDQATQKRLIAAMTKTESVYRNGRSFEETPSFREAKAMAEEARRALGEELKWHEQTAEYRTKGYKVLSLKQSAACFTYGSLRAGYVGAGDVCPLDQQKRTWKALIGDHAKPIVARGGWNPQTRVMYARKDALKALVTAGHADIAKAASAETSEEKRKREDEERKAKQEAKFAVDSVTIEKIVAAAEQRELNAEALRLVVQEMSGSTEHVLRRRGQTFADSDYRARQDAYEKLVEKSDARRLRGLAIELILWEYNGADDEKVAAAAKALGVKVQASGRKGKGVQI